MKKKLFIVALLVVAVAVTMGFTLTNYALAESTPSVNIPEQDAVVVREPGQKTFDVKTLFTIDPGSYNMDELSVAYTLTRDGETVATDNELVIPFADGKYSLVIMVAKSGGAFQPIVETLRFELQSLAPTFRNAESMQEIKTINVQKNQGFIDLRILYKIIGNSYAEDEYTVSFDAKYPGRVVEVFGYFIKSISGVYTLTITIHSNDGSFEDVVSVPMTVIVQKAQPQVVFEYENETGMTTIQDEHTIEIFAGTQFVDLNEYYTVYGNAYVTNEYAASLLVKRVMPDGSYVNCQVFDGTIAPIEGDYLVTVKVDPKIQGAFTPITSRTVTFHIRKAVPRVTTTSLYVNKADEDGNIRLSDYVSVSNSAFANDSYKVEYTFEQDGEVVATSQNNLVKLKDGEYTVTAKVISNDGAFEPQVSQFTMTVEVSSNVGAIVAGSVCGGLVLIGAIAALTVFLIKRGKKQHVSGN